MNRGVFREWVDRRPFRSFVIHCTDGNQYLADTVDYISLTGNGRTVTLWDETLRMTTIDVFHITTVEEVAEDGSAE